MSQDFEIKKYLELIKPGDVYEVLDVNAQCMGDITHFWDGKFDFTEKSKYAIIGVPEDKPVVDMRGPEGTFEGPNSFRKAFYRLSNYFNKPDGLLTDIGNIRIDLDADVSSTHTKLAKVISFLTSRNVFPIVIGGSSDLTYAGVTGLKESGEFKNLGLVSFDSHLDLLDVPDKFVAGSAMKKILDDFSDFISTKNLFFFGSRKENISPYAANIIEKNNIKVNYKDTIKSLKNDLLFALNTALHGTDGVVVSFDLDSCDAGMMPGTSFPIPGGFTPEEVILIAKSLSKFKMAVYLDILELNPRVDTNNITSVMAALFLFHFLEKK